MAQQKLRFKKMTGKNDELEFWVDGAELVRVQNPKQRIVPHDMVHYAIETSFPFEGFIRLVFAGHEPGKTMEALNGFSPKLASEYHETSWITESLVEAMQAALWSQVYGYKDFEYAYQQACKARKIKPVKVQRKDFDSCLALIGRLGEEWTRLAAGEVMELEFIAKPLAGNSPG